jgi:hypothetical protein
VSTMKPTNKIRYRDGYKYQLVETYHVLLAFEPPYRAENEWITLERSGLLTIKAGYAWDGPSGPTLDTLDFMRGSLIHDALYQCLREGLLPQEFRDEADKELLRICKEDGMPDWRCSYVYCGVKEFAKSHAALGSGKPILEAP